MLKLGYCTVAPKTKEMYFQEHWGSAQRILEDLRRAEELYLSLIGPESLLLKIAKSFENEKLKKQICTLYIGLFNVFQELEIHGKNVADAIKRVIDDDVDESQKGRKRALGLSEVEDAEYVEDCINLLIWELKQIKRPMETFNKAKDEKEKLERKLDELADEDNENGPMSRLSDEVLKIISLLDDVLTKLNNGSSIMENHKKNGYFSTESRLFNDVQELAQQFTGNPGFERRVYKKRCSRF